MKKLSILVTLIFMSSVSHAVSFDCAKASTFVEKEICADALLGQLDDALSQNYKHMLASNIGDGAIKDLKVTQKKWLSERNKCATNKCLTEAYRRRVDEICDYPVISGAHPDCTSSDDIQEVKGDSPERGRYICATVAKILEPSEDAFYFKVAGDFTIKGNKDKVLGIYMWNDKDKSEKEIALVESSNKKKTKIHILIDDSQHQEGYAMLADKIEGQCR